MRGYQGKRMRAPTKPRAEVAATSNRADDDTVVIEYVLLSPVYRLWLYNTQPNVCTYVTCQLRVIIVLAHLSSSRHSWLIVLTMTIIVLTMTTIVLTMTPVVIRGSAQPQDTPRGWESSPWRRPARLSTLRRPQRPSRPPVSARPCYARPHWAPAAAVSC